MKYIAYTVKGLEDIAVQEIKENVKEVTITEIKPKRIVCESDDTKSLKELRTSDDICVLLATGQVATPHDILNICNKINLEEVRDLLARERTLTRTFSITYSLVKTKINTDELQYLLSKAIIERYNWQFTEQEHSNYDIRFFVDNKDLYISVRLTQEPLFHRKYRTISSKGGLRPSIASAMVKHVTMGKKGAVVDNFCGSGTILAEAYIEGNNICGGDIENTAVSATLQNIANLGYNAAYAIKQLDALKTPWRDNQFDFAISNLPWDKQVEIKSVTDLYTGALSEYARILKPEGRLCLLVSKPDLLIKHAKAFFPKKKIEKIQIGILGQTPSLITIA